LWGWVLGFRSRAMAIGLVQSLFDVFFLRFRSSRARTSRVGERIKVVFVEQRVDPLIERMGGGRWQVGSGHPQLVLPLSFASGSHGHVGCSLVQLDRFWRMIESSRTD